MLVTVRYFGLYISFGSSAQVIYNNEYLNQIAAAGGFVLFFTLSAQLVLFLFSSPKRIRASNYHYQGLFCLCSLTILIIVSCILCVALFRFEASCDIHVGIVDTRKLHRDSPAILQLKYNEPILKYNLDRPTQFITAQTDDIIENLLEEAPNGYDLTSISCKCYNETSKLYDNCSNVDQDLSCSMDDNTVRVWCEALECSPDMIILLNGTAKGTNKDFKKSIFVTLYYASGELGMHQLNMLMQSRAVASKNDFPRSFGDYVIRYFAYFYVALVGHALVFMLINSPRTEAPERVITKFVFK